MPGLRPLFRPLRPALTAWHRVWSGSARRTAAYGRLLGRIRPIIPAAFADTLVSNFQLVTWPDVDLPAVDVRVSATHAIRLHPHFGEFDVRALVARDLGYERDVFDWLETQTTTYDVVVEIGANVGVFTSYFATRFRSPRGTPTHVVAIEPAPEAYRRLGLNLAANHLTAVTTVNAAVAAERGSVTFYEPAGHLTNGSLVREFATRFSSDIRATVVPAVAGDDLLRLAPEGRTLLKIDVEGGEPVVLAALAGWIADRRPDILIEVLPGYEDAIVRSPAFARTRYVFHRITNAGLVAQTTIVAGPTRDWWLTPAPDA